MDLPKRKRIRLEGYDYSSSGAYFVTICTYNREQTLGDIYVGQGLCSCRVSNKEEIAQDEMCPSCRVSNGDIYVGQGLCSCRVSNKEEIAQDEMRPSCRVSNGDIYVGQGLCSCRVSDKEKIAQDEMRPSCRLSNIGRIVQDEIHRITKRYVGVKIDKYVIMPNHIHLIFLLERQEQSPCPTIGDVVCEIKSISTKNANKIENKSGRKIWQFRFHDHIIRNEREYQKIRRYIDENPLKWEDDCFYESQNLVTLVSSQITRSQNKNV